jgi:cyclophilin family peptidyl-prolyl cis-trans isomerase
MAKKYSAPPQMSIDPAKAYAARLETSLGSIVMRLDPSGAPKTVNNFVTLARDGFYDGTVFHRVIKGFMIQGGDPTGTGRGGPGYNFEDEFESGRGFDKAGLLAMANAGPNTNGSQFFITQVPTPHLNNRHTIFGEVVEGFDIVERIVAVPTGSGDKPREDVVLTKVSIDEGR